MIEPQNNKQASIHKQHSNTHKLIDWQAIDTVLLDMDGTLLDLHFDNYFWLEHLPKRYAEHHKIDEELARSQLHRQIKQLEGTLQWYCLDHWSECVQMDIPALKREISHKIQVRPHTQKFLQFLHTQHKKVILVTNAHRSGLNIKLEVTAIDQWLDLVISSHDYQTPKESPLFWQQLHKAEHFDPTRSLFIDDTPHIVGQAGEFGIKHLICITQPDSQKPPRPPCGQNCLYIQDFDEII